MKLIKIIIASIYTMLAISTVNASELQNHIRNFKPLTNNISTSGSIGARGYAALKAASFDMIIDLRTPPEGTKAEQKQVNANRMAYSNIPLDGRNISKGQVAQLNDILNANKGKKILIHCVSANRVGALWTALQLSKNVPKATAFKQGRAIGMGAYLENWLQQNGDQF